MPELNPEQRAAVEHGDGPLLVVAGPGTGKTRVITEHIVWLLENSGAAGCGRSFKPENILALTFTDKAAGEMKRRVSAALPHLETFPMISTFHAFCYHVLRRHQADRRLLDKVDVWIFLRRRMAELGLDFYQKLAEPGAFLHDLNEFFSRCQDELIEPGDFDVYVRQCELDLRRRCPRIAAILDDGASRPRRALKDLAAAEYTACDDLLKQQELARVFRASRRMIEESGSSSLGSLVSETVALWRRNTVALEEARAQHRAVLVDEFQDTNYGQVELLKLLVPPPYAITAVGDDDQAIYRFRGASHSAFEMFTRAFPGHEVVYLAQNYRSTRRILTAAGRVIAHNDRYAEKPDLSSSGCGGYPVHVVKAADAEAEAAWIAQEIERLKGQGIPFGDMAVLYRAHGYRDHVVNELRRRKIALSIRGVSVLSAAVLRNLVAYLRVIHSPHENISFTRVLAAPEWRVPAALAQAIRDHAATRRSSLYDAIRKDAPAAVAEGLKLTEWTRLERLLTDFRRLARARPVTDLLDYFVERLGWKFVPGDPRQTCLETFRSFLHAWEEKSETRQLREFIEYFDYFIEAGGKIEAPEVAGDAVQLMTAHAAKGLEFPVVFVIGLSPRRFPSTERKPVIEFPAALRRGPAPPRDIHIQEERRLFFVALTRAKGRLYVSGVSKSDRQQSVFLRELISDPAVAARDLEVIEAPQVEFSNLKSLQTVSVGEARRASPLTSVKPSKPARQALLFDAADHQRSGSIADVAAQTPEAGRSSRLHLSATSAEDYLACPLKYKFRHVLKIPTGPQAALTFGNLMHQCVRRYFELRREKQLTGSLAAPSASLLPAFEEIEQFYFDRWTCLGFDDAYHEDTYRKAGLEQLRGFVEKHNAIAIDTRKIKMEQSFEVSLDSITLEGRIDQVNLLEPVAAREAELVDYKTGRARTEKDAEKSLQLSLYALVAKRALGLNPSRLTFYNLSTNDPASSVRTASDLSAAEEKIQEVAAGIRAGGFDPTPGFVCRWCDYVPLCPAHED